MGFHGTAAAEGARSCDQDIMRSHLKKISIPSLTQGGVLVLGLPRTQEPNFGCRVAQPCSSKKVTTSAVARSMFNSETSQVYLSEEWCVGGVGFMVVGSGMLF